MHIEEAAESERLYLHVLLEVSLKMPASVLVRFFICSCLFYTLYIFS